jgi:hypothetical protein
MDGEGKRSRLRTFVLGGLVGASAVLAALRRRRPGGAARPPRAGLAAFEDAPCYAELLEQERPEGPDGGA